MMNWRTPHERINYCTHITHSRARSGSGRSTTRTVLPLHAQEIIMIHLWSKLSDRVSVCGRALFTDRLTWSPVAVTCAACNPGVGRIVHIQNTNSTPFARMNRLSGE